MVSTRFVFHTAFDDPSSMLPYSYAVLLYTRFVFHTAFDDPSSILPYSCTVLLYTRFVFHTAFDDPSSPPDAVPRKSIEIRAIAFYGVQPTEDADGVLTNTGAQQVPHE
jgi:hypothetical protein